MHREELRGDSIFIIREFLTRAECQGFIRMSENLGYEDAPITTSSGFEMRRDIRDNSRVILDDQALADDLWIRVEQYMVPTWFYRKPIGLNERFRFYRYGPQQRFRPHFDGSLERDNGERSEFTFLVYLNDDFEGGETVFFEPDILRVRPETGLALVFHHPQLHEGAVIESGTKYVMRTDVMYGGDK